MLNIVVISLRIARRFRSITLSTRTMADHTPSIRLRWTSIGSPTSSKRATMVLLIFVRERGAEAEVSSKQLVASVGRCVPRPE